jgi:hypothetical protein
MLAENLRARNTLGDLDGDGLKIYEYVIHIYQGVSCEGVS